MIKEQMSDFKEQIPRELHQVTYNEFLNTQVKEPESFDWKSPITRQNFMSWLETSFRISQGQPSIQHYFFEWSRQNLGFDYKSSLDNFFEASNIKDSWDFISNNEAEFFASRFKSINKHREEFRELIDINTIDSSDIFDSVEAQINGVEDDMARIKRGIYQKYPILRRLNGMSPDQFKIEARKDVERLREERTERRKKI